MWCRYTNFALWHGQDKEYGESLIRSGKVKWNKKCKVSVKPHKSRRARKQK